MTASAREGVRCYYFLKVSAGAGEVSLVFINNIMAKKNTPKGYGRFKWSDQALTVLKERYLAKDNQGKVIETPEGMLYRVAKRIASAENKFKTPSKEINQITKDFYNLMGQRYFLPNSPTLMNAGRDDSLQYSACFVLPIPDSIEGIFNAVKYAALIHKSGGGTGFDFSNLRARGSIVGSTRGVASGPISFMRVFDAATGEVKQGGMRRGANMGILRIDHPDIEEFIECKVKGGVTNFNISIGITNRFMSAALKNKDYWLYDQISKKKVKKLKAKEIFKKIAQIAWQTGDPGLIFLDDINSGRANPVPEMGPVAATNPCGEQPLYSNEACNLGSLNLALIIKNGKVDWDLLSKTTKLAVRFLDDVIEVNNFPLEQITEVVLLNRRIGLGVMGWADMLFQLGIPYNSSSAYQLGQKIMKFIQKNAHQSSQQLAKKRGAFPNFDKSIYKKGPALRNATLTTIAPTGSLSIIANCSSGIEPLFALSFKHKANDRELSFFNQYFLKAAERHKVEQEVLDQVEAKGHLEGLEVPASLKKVFLTAHQINWKDHINMQAAFQKGTDNAVSKTINFPYEAVVKEIEDAYLYAFKKDCLGITVYRDGCKETQVLYAGNHKEKSKVADQPLVKPRPLVVSGRTHRVETPVGRAFVVVNTNGGGELLEVFINVGKAGSDIAADAEAIGRLISLSLRLNSDSSSKEVLSKIIDQLDGIGGGESIGFGKDRIRSLADGIAKVLKDYLDQQATPSGLLESEAVSEQPSLLNHQNARRDLCPACGHASLVFTEGCVKCFYCGFNKC